MFVYTLMSKSTLENYQTNGTANTETEQAFLKPGTRNIALQALIVGGKGAGLTALSGIAYRIKKWTTTAGSGGTAATPAPSDPGAQACKATAGWSATLAAAITPGTGGPTLQCGCVSGAAGPGGWVAANPDSMKVLEGSATQSLDLFVASGTVSMNYEANLEFQE
jgi:hypothetical protein